MKVSRKTTVWMALVALMLCVSQGAVVAQEEGSSPGPVHQTGVMAYIDGQRRPMSIEQARSYGLTVIDLSDDWVPYIFWAQTPGRTDYKPNAYMDDYIDLANDRIDVDGARLRRTEHNYLEVFGIPPSLSVLRKRFLEDEQRACAKSAAAAIFTHYDGPLRINDEASSRRLKAQLVQAEAALHQAQRQSGQRSLELLIKHPVYGKVALAYRRLHWQVEASRAMQQRLVCEGLLEPSKHSSGEVSHGVVEALKRYERKHNIFGGGLLLADTAASMARSLRENNFESLKRVIEERVISATGILEDGTSTASYRAADGTEQHVRDLVSEFRQAALTQLGLTDADRALAFMRDHEAKEFGQFLVALRLPALPEYYSDRMELSTVIDRGDVWYDLPFDEKGKPLAQPRSRLPLLTFYVNYHGQQIPLVRWRTTIGGWQKEMRGNEEYYKYKISDVGKRVWRHIVAGPVWVPPPATPATDMIKLRDGKRIVAQSAFGPGYASAYGLVAGYHVTSDGFDNQVRTHGTVNYMSVRQGFSHGCHRLRNHNAVRLFSFVLRHRAFARKGQIKLAHTHRYEFNGEEYQLNLHTRGYYYELTPPLPVNVLEGTIRGKLKQPTTEYVKKPTQVYQEDLPGGRGRQHGQPGAAPQPNRATTADPMQQHQAL